MRNPDEAIPPDYRSGFGTEGTDALKTFVQKGGIDFRRGLIYKLIRVEDIEHLLPLVLDVIPLTKWPHRKKRARKPATVTAQGTNASAPAAVPSVVGVPGGPLVPPSPALPPSPVPPSTPWRARTPTSRPPPEDMRAY